VTTSAARTYPGIDRHGDKWRVRVLFPAPYGRYSELVDDLDGAIVRRAELVRRRKDGRPPIDEAGADTLADACATLLRQKRKLTPAGLAYWARSLRPWAEGEFSAVRLAELRRAPIEDALDDRALVAPTSARNERQALIAALELAGERGATFDLAILRIPPVEVEARVRRALSAAELEWFAAHVAPVARRLVLLQGTVGNRVDELFRAEPAHVDLGAATLYVPAANCKERVGKTIPLTPEEVELVAEQLGGLRVVGSSRTAGLPARAPGSPWLFTTAGARVYESGKVVRTAQGPTRWRHPQFDRLVWQPAVSSAATDWRAEHGLADVVVAGRLVPAPTPFEWFVDPSSAPADARRRVGDDGRRWITTHDLRATAVTLMRDAGVSREDAAARVGHADRGELVDAVYDKGSRSARVARALAEAAPAGLRAALA
jgi:integrase